MSGVYFLLPALLTVFISFLIVRGGAIALMMTGMDRNRAIFQALSAFTGTGFTTSEAESVTRNYKRRRIISILMILGNAGIVAVLITAGSSLFLSRGLEIPLNAVLMVVGLYVVYRLANYKGLIRRWESYVEKYIIKKSASEKVALESVMGFMEGYGLVRAVISKGSRYIGMTVSEMLEGDSRVRVLGIGDEDDWKAFPEDSATIAEGDMLVLYGPINIITAHFKS